MRRRTTWRREPGPARSLNHLLAISSPCHAPLSASLRPGLVAPLSICVGVSLGREADALARWRARECCCCRSAMAACCRSAAARSSSLSCRHKPRTAEKGGEGVRQRASRQAVGGKPILGPRQPMQVRPPFAGAARSRPAARLRSLLPLPAAPHTAISPWSPPGPCRPVCGRRALNKPARARRVAPSRP